MKNWDYCTSCPHKQGLLKFHGDICPRCEKSGYKIYRKMMYDIHGKGEEISLDIKDIMLYLSNVIGRVKKSPTIDDELLVFDDELL